MERAAVSTASLLQYWDLRIKSSWLAGPGNLETRSQVTAKKTGVQASVYSSFQGGTGD